jgi:ribose 5-phosphate isomerase A
MGIGLVPLSQAAPLVVTLDGADEVSPQLDLIKGLGGALLREKLVAQNSKQLVIIADSSKRVDKLGSKSPVPVEVAQFEHEMTAKFLRSLGCDVTLRAKSDGANYVTDNGNFIYDCRFPSGIDDPAELSSQLQDRAGVVESGLFLNLATVALIAGERGVDTLTR